MSETPVAWERQPYDTAKSWAMFQLYLEQDAPRSIAGCYRKWQARKGKKEARQVPGSFRAIAAGKTSRAEPIPGALSFEERARAFDDYVTELERRKWVERRLKLKEQEWESGTKLLEKVQQMLMFPVMAQESADGRTIIMPAGWNFRDVPAMLSAASKIARLAAEMHTDSIKLDWREEAKKYGVDNPDAIFRELVDKLEGELARDDAAGSLAGSSPAQAS